MHKQAAKPVYFVRPQLLFIDAVFACEYDKLGQDVTELKDAAVFGEKIDGIEYRDRTGAYGVVEDRQGRAVIVRTPTGYFLIGGGIEPGEDDEDALRREFLEETGYTIAIKESIGASTGYYYSDDFAQYMHGTGHFYRVELLERAAEPIEKDHTLVYLEKIECVSLLKYDYQRWAVVSAFGLY